MQAKQLFTRWHLEDRSARVLERTQIIAFRGAAVRRLEPTDFRIIDR